MRSTLTALLLLFITVCSGQTCETGFVRDTMTIPETGKVLNGQYLETTLKNFSVVRLYKDDDNKFYLRMIVTKNFYFGKTSELEIRSGSKSYWAKNTTQHKVTKTSGLFLIEIYKNYVGTLKDNGITSIVFSEAETDFTRQDANQIKAIAKCFYESISAKKQ